MGKGQSEKLNCLVVDDNVDIFPIIEIALSETFNSSYAPDAFTAHQMLSQRRYDLLLCDIKMPHMGGFGLVEELHKKMIRIPIIFISGMMDEEAVRQAFRLGAANVIGKPLDMQELIDKCNRAIKLSGETQAQHEDSSDQEIGYIYNLLKTHYYDIQVILHQIHLYNIPLEVIRQELDKKQRIGKCHLDDPENIKFLSKAA